MKFALLSADCPIIKKKNYLKKSCIEDLGYAVYQCHNSNSYYVVSSREQSHWHYSIFDSICEADPYFYQTCGEGIDKLASNNATLCGDYICQPQTMPQHFLNMDPYSIPPDMACQRQPCDGRPCWDTPVCTNLDLSSAACTAALGPAEITVRLKTGLVVPQSTVCNGRCDIHYRCEDEALCGGYLYGMYCNGYQGALSYVYPSHMCNGMDSHLCQNGEDELECPDVTNWTWTEKCERFDTQLGEGGGTKALVSVS